MSSEEREPPTILKKLSKSYEHLDRFSLSLLLFFPTQPEPFFYLRLLCYDESLFINHKDVFFSRERKISRPSDIVGFGLLPNQVNCAVFNQTVNDLIMNCFWKVFEMRLYQVYRKAVKKGFEFSLMVVGESGLGKSTLVSWKFYPKFVSYFFQYFSKPGELDVPDGHIQQRWRKGRGGRSNVAGVNFQKVLKVLFGFRNFQILYRESWSKNVLNFSLFWFIMMVQVETHECMLEENGVRLALTVVDTPGYGDAVDNT